ncbi:MAG TPA: hypothetical protein VFE78_39015, partial [Gemmataceae bacterium]|nr:hypothetical protein [Gemmataceae bacterium]
MPHGRLLIPLLVLAAAAGRAAAQADTAARPMPAGPAAGPCDSAPCPPTCAPPPRVRVIVPPPEVVFCAPANAPAKRGCGLFHHGQPCAAPCVPAAPCAAPCVAAPVAPVTPPGGGMVSFNMNMAMPYMTYQMTPMMMGSAGFAGAGMMGGGFGMPMGGMPMVLPAGGLNLGMGLGGGLQMSLGGNAL